MSLSLSDVHIKWLEQDLLDYSHVDCRQNGRRQESVGIWVTGNNPKLIKRPGFAVDNGKTTEELLDIIALYLTRFAPS